MAITVGEIAAAIQAEIEGDPSIVVTHAAEPAAAGKDALAMAMSPKYGAAVEQGNARAAIVWPGADWRAMGLEAAVIVSRERVAMAGLTRMFDPGQGFPTGVHPQAVVDPSAEIGEGVSIGPLSVIASGARIGAGSIIGPLCYVGTGAELGPNSLLREHVSIGARVKIGARFVAQPGARVGSDGFSFVTPEKSRLEVARETLGAGVEGAVDDQSYVRIHSLGSVVIGDDVELGANSTIDSGTVRPTTIGDGCKFDNLVQVGHNCKIGRNLLMCGQAGLAGSVKVGDNVVLAGQSGIADNKFVGDGAIATGASKVTGNIPAGRVVMGYPATAIETHVSIYKALRRLPRLMADVAKLQKAVFKPVSKD